MAVKQIPRHLCPRLLKLVRETIGQRLGLVPAVDRTDLESQELTPKFLAGLDCVVIATDHSAYDYEYIVEHAPLVVDTRNATKRSIGCSNIRKA